MDAFVRESSAFVRESSVITVLLVIKYDPNGWEDLNRDMDSWSIKVRFKAEIAKFALKTLKKLFERWSFELVSVEVHKT